MSALVRKFETYDLDEGKTVVHYWLLAGDRGAVHFKASPMSDVGHEIALRFPSINTLVDGWSWQGFDLGYHSPRPRYDGQKPMASCDVIEGLCYYDGTSLGAGELLGKWAAAGRDDDVIWAEMESRYSDWLCSDEETFASPVTLLSEALRRVSAS